MKTEIFPASHPTAIPHALDVLSRNGVVAFPTDTVYGLGAQADNIEAIERLYLVKGRSHTKAIAILIGNVAQLDQIAINVSPAARKLAENFWPGPLTLILYRHPDLPELLAPEPTIGVRIPNHPDALALMAQTGPLAVTSANLSGGANANTAQEVQQQLAGRVHLILDGGPTPGGVPSTVVDCTSDQIKILRPGPLSLAKLKKAIQ